MATNLTKEIAAKVALLPNNLQREALEFVELLVAREQNARESKQPFESVEGTLQGNYDTLEEDISKMRCEAWKNFPRDLEL